MNARGLGGVEKWYYEYRATRAIENAIQHHVLNAGEERGGGKRRDKCGNEEEDGEGERREKEGKLTLEEVYAEPSGLLHLLEECVRERKQKSGERIRDVQVRRLCAACPVVALFTARVLTSWARRADDVTCVELADHVLPVCAAGCGAWQASCDDSSGRDASLLPMLVAEKRDEARLIALDKAMRCENGTMEMWSHACGLIVPAWRWIPSCVYFAKFATTRDGRHAAARVIVMILAGVHPDVARDAEECLKTFASVQTDPTDTDDDDDDDDNNDDDDTDMVSRIALVMPRKRIASNAYGLGYVASLQLYAALLIACDAAAAIREKDSRTPASITSLRRIADACTMESYTLVLMLRRLFVSHAPSCSSGNFDRVTRGARLLLESVAASDGSTAMETVVPESVRDEVHRLQLLLSANR